MSIGAATPQQRFRLTLGCTDVRKEAGGGAVESECNWETSKNIIIVHYCVANVLSLGFGGFPDVCVCVCVDLMCRFWW